MLAEEADEVDEVDVERAALGHALSSTEDVPGRVTLIACGTSSISRPPAACRALDLCPADSSPAEA